MTPLKKKFNLEQPFTEKELKPEKTDELNIPETTSKDIQDVGILNVLPDKEIDEQDLMMSRSRDKKDFHNHDGINSELISIINLIGLIETVTTVPTHSPKTFYEQFKIYYDDTGTPTDRKLYIYSNKAQEWSYIALTV
jgi:hypothetical protein